MNDGATRLTKSPPHEVLTDRLILRSARAGDGPALREAISVSLDDFFPWLPFSAELSDVETMERISRLAQDKFLEDEFYVWRAWEPDGLLVGSVDLHSFNHRVPSCEIGFWTRSDRAGRGLAREFVTAAIEIAQNTLGMHRIEARCDARNERAWRFVERLGFEFEGIARDDDRNAAGDLCSTKVYALLRAPSE